MGIKKKDIEREYRKFFLTWLPKVVERGQIIMLNVRGRNDIKEDDWDVLKFFYKSYHNGELSCFMPEVSPLQGQNMTNPTQPELFPDKSADSSQDVTVHPPTLVFGIDIYNTITQTKEKEK